MNADGTLMDVNPAGIELFGYTPEELANIDIAGRLYCDPLERKRYMQALTENGFVRNFEAKLQRKDGGVLTILLTASVTLDERGMIAGYRGIIHDVTERNHLEQQLIQAQKMESIGFLAGGVAHDFNNLMTAVIGYGQLIRERVSGEDEMMVTSIEQVLEAARRATDLTRSLLAFSRKQIINPKPSLLNDIIVNVSKLLHRIIGEDIDFRTQLTGRSPLVLVNQGQIDQVLVNLAANARDAMPNGGKLLISTGFAEVDRETARQKGMEKSGSYAYIAVTDTGTGMDARTRERIFEPFFTTKERGKGTGLGLSIIYGIVKQHNGTVVVESEPGQGATFTVYLPLMQVAADEDVKKEEPVPVYGSETVLLAEDDTIVRQLLAEVLMMAGYTVISARNGEEAVELFREHRKEIDIVVTDVVMPRKNGKEVFDAICGMAPETRFIFMSGYTDEIIHQKGLLDESLAYITKPIGRNDLLSKVREVLDH